MNIGEKVMLSVDYGKGVDISIIMAHSVSNFRLK